MNYKACVIIPVFRHVSQLQKCAQNISIAGLQVFLIDDGNSEEDRNKLVNLAEKHAFQILTHQNNLGKGAALKTAIQFAATEGFSHAIQIDADGQHDISDIETFIKASQDNPRSLILGTPIFDSSAPFCRVYGRKITTAVIRLETFSNKVSDALFGFRVYPIAETKLVIDNAKTSNRMGFDPEIVVRLSWNDIEIVTIPSKVIYPENGFSNFEYFEDNLSFILLHTKLIILALLNFLVLRPLKSLHSFIKKKRNSNWFEKSEHGNKFVLKLALLLYRFGGRRGLKVLLYPVILYFYLTDSAARKSSKEYLDRIYIKNGKLPQKPNWKLVYQHFYTFGLKIVTSIQAWNGDIEIEDIDWHNREIMYDLLDKKQGGVIISAHFGCLEVCRALRATQQGLKIVPLMYLKNAKIFRDFLKELNPTSNEEIIEIDQIHAGVAVDIQSRIDKGQFISILADRIPDKVKESKTLRINFLDKDASIPEGPFTLASIFNCPVVTFISYYDANSKRYQVYIDKLEIKDNKASSRAQKSQEMAEIFFSRLEYHCLKQPFEWFNFFPFWNQQNS